MARMLVIADDLSGALDTGVVFVQNNIDTLVMMYSSIQSGCLSSCDASVLVVDAQTRHLDSAEAYRRVYGLVKEAKALGLEYIYKKTDSALRGNVGIELQAALDASGEAQIHFVPAFPKHNRYTINGIHYIDNVPVADSVFGRDPYNPISTSSVLELIAGQTDTAATLSDAAGIHTDARGIIVYNVKSPQEMEQIASGLDRAGKLSLLAGCGGLASAVVQYLRLPQRAKAKRTLLSNGLLVVCGSMNPITLAQLSQGEACGYARLRLPPELKLGGAEQPLVDAFFAEWKKASQGTGFVIIDANDREDSENIRNDALQKGIALEQVRERITHALGRITKRILDEGLTSALMVTGGDTALGIIGQLGLNALVPLCEIAPGVILSELVYKGRPFQMITKSGGFGGKDLLVNLMRDISKGLEL